MHPENQAAGMGEVIGLSECTRLPSTWSPELLGPGKCTEHRPNRVCAVVEYLNLSSLDLGSTYKPGPASDSSWQSNLEPKQCRQGKHTRHEWGQTQCGPDIVSTCQCYLQRPPSPLHD